MPKRRYKKPTAKDLGELHFARKLGKMGIEVAETKEHAVYRKSYVLERRLEIIEKLIKAGVNVEEPLVRIVEGKKIHARDKKGRAYFVGKGDRFSELVGTLTDAERKTVFKNLALQIAKMHRAGVVHKDLHVYNIVIQRDSLKVSFVDFALAKEVQIDFNEPKSLIANIGLDIGQLFLSLFDRSYKGPHFKNRKEINYFLNELIKAYKLKPAVREQFLIYLKGKMREKTKFYTRLVPRDLRTELEGF